MKITQEEVVDRQTVLHIELEDEDLDPYLDRGFRRVAQRAVIPGFRKGKAPRRIVEHYLGREVLLNEVLDTMLPEVTGLAIDEQKLEAAGMPQIELLDLEPVTVKATVPLAPDIDLGPYRDIRLEEEKEEITEEDIQQRLEQLQHSQATWEPVERPTQLGDMVTISVTGEVDGEQIIDEKDTEYFLDEDSARPFPGFAENLVGMELDQTKEFTLTIPEDFSDDNYAGKEVRFSVSVSEAKERNLPELDDEFAKGVGEGYDSMGALREEVEREAKEELETNASQKYREEVIDAFLNGVTLDLAPVMVEHEVDHMEEEQARMLSRFNVRLDDFLRSRGTTQEEVRGEMREEAEERIKRSFALSRLAEVEGIEVSDEEVEDRIQSIFSRDNADEDEEELPEQPEVTDEMRETVGRMLRGEKTIDRLVAIARGEAPPLPEAKEEATEEEPEDTETAEEEKQKEEEGE